MRAVFAVTAMGVRHRRRGTHGDRDDPDRGPSTPTSHVRIRAHRPGHASTPRFGSVYFVRAAVDPPLTPI